MVGVFMRDVEVRLVAELMKNSRRSDRELSKILGVSQPTVTRIRSRLEREGIIREYTVIPDFSKLGYQLVGFTLVKHRKPLSREESKEVRKKTIELEKKNPHADILAVNGIGLEKDVLFITFYEDYSKYSKAMTHNIAELGLGLNERIKKPIGYVLTDEKIGGSAHIAIGDNRAYGGTSD
jgi:DNA-binding Lrp family transcriptional regulator